MYSTKFFVEQGKAAQDKLRNELGEEAYRALKSKAGKKGGRPRKIDIIK